VVVRHDTGPTTASVDALQAGDERIDERITWRINDEMGGALIEDARDGGNARDGRVWNPASPSTNPHVLAMSSAELSSWG
jgi:hypothetical protein